MPFLEVREEVDRREPRRPLLGRFGNQAVGDDEEGDDHVRGTSNASLEPFAIDQFAKK